VVVEFESRRCRTDEQKDNGSSMVKAERDQAGMSDSARSRQAGASARTRTKHGFGGSFVSGIEWSRVQPRSDGWQAVTSLLVSLATWRAESLEIGEIWSQMGLVESSELAAL
jgi:hypothetical protein